jgi:hypothetical protein
MREIRSSGSVEGVMSNRDSYSDFLVVHPEKRMRDGGMPPVNLDDAHLQLLVLYLSGLRSSATQGVHPAAGSSSANPASAVTATSSAIAQAPRPPLSPEALRGRNFSSTTAVRPATAWVACKERSQPPD